MGKIFTGVSCFFSSYISSLIQKKKPRLGCNLTNIKYKLCKSQNYLYDRYHSISRTKTDAKWTKWPINKHRVSLKNEKLNKLLIRVHAFFLQYFYKHCRTDIDKNSSKCLAAIWGWTFAVWKWFILHSHYYPKIIGHILKITKWTGVSIFMRLYGDKNEKQITHIQHK